MVVAIGLFALWIAGLVCALLCRGGALGGWFRLVPSLGEMVPRLSTEVGGGRCEGSNSLVKV